MPPKSRFTRLDAFTKTVDEARIRTTSGGIVTIVSLVVVLFLSWGEWNDYRRIVARPELVVDKGRGERMDIFLNISFPHMPCELLTLDVMDVSGEQQHEVSHGLSKVRLSPVAQGSKPIEVKQLDQLEQKATHLDPNYCGNCYGATAPSNAQKSGCCNTCDEVREAYAQASWAFGRGENVEQCEREHYAEKLDQQRNEGCGIAGRLHVNKVVGNFHLAPGRSFSNGNMHVHDLKNYWEVPDRQRHDFTHIIHRLRFGIEIPLSVTEGMSKSTLPWNDHQLSPLDGTRQDTSDSNSNFMYFVKVVPTTYVPLGWGRPGSAFETHQYSVTSHRRSLMGGDDSKEGHAERLHSKGGIPGVFFSYDISPMKVINREEQAKSFLGFLSGLCAVIGGTLTVAAAVDRGLFEGVTRLKKLQSKNL